jgi:hypothetical protein
MALKLRPAVPSRVPQKAALEELLSKSRHCLSEVAENQTEHRGELGCDPDVKRLPACGGDLVDGRCVAAICTKELQGR